MNNNPISCKSIQIVIFLIPVLAMGPLGFAEEIVQPANEEAADATTQVSTNQVLESLPAAVAEPSTEFVRQAWEASGHGDLAKLQELADQMMGIYGQQAKEQQSSLSGFPARGKEGDYQALNDVATVLFVKGEALMNFGKPDEAKVVFHQIIDEYKWSQAWDPRGWFWSVAEKSQASIDVMEGNVKEEPDVAEERLKTIPKLAFPGTAKIIDYTKYGKFIDVGTKDYVYEVKDQKGLSDAIGEGIYPNTGGVLKDPGYKKAVADGRLNGSHWDFVYSDDLEAAFYKWATAPEPGGIKLFYIGLILEKAKMYYEALKAYHALVVHYPKSVGWTYWQTPWYPAQAAVAKIKHIIRTHPELSLKTQWMKVEITNGFDNDISNDGTLTFPGVIKEKDFWDQIKERFNLEKSVVQLGKIKKTLGQGNVHLVQYENNHWHLIVDGKPFIIHGMTYHPTKIGQSPDKGTLEIGRAHV